VTPRLLLGFDLTAIGAAASYFAAGVGDVKRSLTIVNLDAVATFFPMQRGLFLRGGLGLSGLSSEIEIDGVSTSDSSSGANVLAGVGYAFWLGRSFNLTVNLDFSAQGYGDTESGAPGPDSSSFWTLGLGFDWY
jgi:hypothetical protein